MLLQWRKKISPQSQIEGKEDEEQGEIEVLSGYVLPHTQSCNGAGFGKREDRPSPHFLDPGQIDIYFRHRETQHVSDFAFDRVWKLRDLVLHQVDLQRQTSAFPF